MSAIRRFLLEDDGPTAVEYAVMLAMIIAACTATITLLGGQTAGSFADSAADITTAMEGGGQQN